MPSSSLRFFIIVGAMVQLKYVIETVCEDCR